MGVFVVDTLCLVSFCGNLWGCWSKYPIYFTFCSDVLTGNYGMLSVFRHNWILKANKRQMEAFGALTSVTLSSGLFNELISRAGWLTGWLAGFRRKSYPFVCQRSKVGVDIPSEWDSGARHEQPPSSIWTADVTNTRVIVGIFSAILQWLTSIVRPSRILHFIHFSRHLGNYLWRNFQSQMQRPSNDRNQRSSCIWLLSILDSSKERRIFL